MLDGKVNGSVTSQGDDAVDLTAGYSGRNKFVGFCDCWSAQRDNTMTGVKQPVTNDLPNGSPTAASSRGTNNQT